MPVAFDETLVTFPHTSLGRYETVDRSRSFAIKEYRIAKQRNTYAKRQREQEKRQRADDNRLKRERKLAAPAGNPSDAANANLVPPDPEVDTDPA